MPQLFHPSTNVLAKASIVLVTLALGAAGLIVYGVNVSSYVTQQYVVRQQPVPFSHEHHVNGLGIDCRYCHTTVEQTASAGMPSTKTCMTCHSQIWFDAPMLEPVRESWRTNQPLRWTRVHDLPDHVYFDHSIHVNKGIGCQTCHGQVNEMPLMWKVESLQMTWCLDCHRQPEKFIRPRENVFDMDYRAPRDQLRLGGELVQQYHIYKDQLTNCSICHR
jgi:hypothetical protein